MSAACAGALSMICVLGLMGLGGARDDDDQRLEVAEVPAAVRQAADKALPGAKWTEAVKETEDDGAVYRLEGTNPRGHEAQVEISAEGKVQSLEISLGHEALAELPAGVRSQAEKAVPGATWSEAVIRTEEDEEETTYTLKGTDAKGAAVEVAVELKLHVASVETALDLKNLPHPLAELVKSVSGVTWNKAVRKVGEETTFEAAGSDAQEHDVTALIDENGDGSIRTELEIEDVPAAISNALKERLPTFQPGSAASVCRQVVTSYELEGEDKEGKGVTVSVSADGKSIDVEANDDDDDDDDDA